MSEPSGQAAGLASKTAATQAFWIVVRRAGQDRGDREDRLGDVGFAGSDLNVSSRLAPSALLVLPCVEALTAGLNGSEAQFATWKGEETLLVAPWRR